MSNATATSQSPATAISRGNVSVTNINCELDSKITENGVADSDCKSFANIALAPKMEESDDGSDSELSNIEKTAKVSMRQLNTVTNGQRPMSWDADLSETEMMEVEKSGSPSVEESKSKMPTICEDVKPKLHLLEDKTVIKPEICTPTKEIVGNSNGLPQFPKKYPEIMNLKFEPNTSGYQEVNHSPLLVRSKQSLLPANPSPDSAIHSIYTQSSPSQSPLTSRHAPYTPSLSRNNSDASHSSCYSYSSEFNSPTHSPIQGRHPIYASTSNSQQFNGSLHHSLLYRPMLDSDGSNYRLTHGHHGEENNNDQSDQIPTAGISRQQLINSPCPICGDKISGFHYGIFSCESCKGFFKRTVQNRKNYVCLRGAACPVTVTTRKKCPACRFEKCLQKGMKLEAIREDRTRGGRSTYQCSYTLPSTSLSNLQVNDSAYKMNSNGMKMEHLESNGLKMLNNNGNSLNMKPGIPALLQEIMDVEYLWQYNESELIRLNQTSASTEPSITTASIQNNPLLASAGLSSDNSSPDMIANLCKIADHRLYKIVKWCKSLPLFKNISIDDQICLLINSWCELLLFSCCFRSISSPGEIKISLGKSINIAQAKLSGLHICIERMLNLTDHLRRLKVDTYEYVAMKVIVLLSSDTSELKEPEKVRASQEKALQALQAYTLGHYPDTPAKFGELLLRIPELQRTCQVGKEMLTIKSKEGEEPSFNLLMELLRGEH